MNLVKKIIPIAAAAWASHGLIGSAFAEVSVTPNPVEITIRSGDTATVAVTLQNESNAVGTDWSVSVSGPGTGLDEVLAAVDGNLSAITELIPLIHDFSDDATGSTFYDSGRAMFVHGNRLSTDLTKFTWSYTFNQIVEGHAAVGPEGAYFTLNRPGLFFLAADLDGASTFTIGGGIDPPGERTREGVILASTVAGVSYRGFVTRTFGVGNVSINHIVIVPESPAASHTFLKTTEREQHVVSGLEDTDRLYYLLFSSADGRRLSDPEALKIMETFLRELPPVLARVSGAKSGQLAPDASRVVTIAIDADGMLGQKQAMLKVNSGGIVTEVPINISVTSSPGLRIEGGPTEDFGAAHLDTSIVRRFIRLRNAGTQALVLSNWNVTGDPAFSTTSSSNLLVPAGSFRDIEVHYAPQTAGNHTAELSFDTNDPTDPMGTVALSGSAFEIPLSGAPESLTSTVFAGDTAEIPITLDNSSANPIIWEFSVPETTELEGLLAKLDGNFSNITSLIPERFDFSDGVTGININDGGGNMFDTGNYLNTNLSFWIPYSDGVITSHTGLGPTGRYFTRKHPGLFVFASDRLEAIDHFEILGKTGGSARTVESRIFSIQFRQTTYAGYFKRSFASGESSVNHLIIVPDAPASATHTLPQFPERDDDRVDGIYGVPQIFYLLFSSQTGGEVDDSTAKEIMRQFILMLDPPWLGGEPSSGQLAGQSASSVNASIDTAGLTPGNHQLTLTLNWDDGAAPEAIDIPVSIMVTPAAGLRIEGGRDRDFGSVYANYGEAHRNIRVSNAGNVTLAVSNFAITGSEEFTISDNTHFLLQPGEWRDVEVNFVPTTPGNRSASLSFLTNDPTDETAAITLSGVAVEPPLAVTPGTLTLPVAAGDTAELALTIENNTAGPVDWQTPPADDPDLNEVLAALDVRFNEITDLIPSRYDFTEGVTGFTIANGGDGLFRNGNRFSTNFGGTFPYTSGNINAHEDMGPAGRYFTRKHPGLFVFAADLDEDFRMFRIFGEAGDFTGAVQQFQITTRLGHQSYTGFFKRSFGGTKPSVNHLFIVPDAPSSASHMTSPNARLDEDRVDGLDGARRLYYLLFSSQNGGEVDNDTAIQIMRAFLRLLDPAWHAAAPVQSGQLPAGGTTGLTVAIDSSGIAPGLHLAPVVVGWDDPLLPGAAQIPLQLTVASAPGLKVENGGLEDFGDGYLNATGVRRSIRISNAGTEPLELSNLRIAGSPSFTLTDDSDRLLAPGAFLDLEVFFQPDTLGDAVASLQFSTNDPTDLSGTISLTGSGLVAPVAITSPTLSISLHSGDTERLPIDLENMSTATVNWRTHLTRQGGTGLEEVLSSLDKHFENITALIPSRYDFTDGVEGTRIPNGGDGMFSGGNQIESSLSSGALPYSDGVIATVAGIGSEERYFTRKYPGLWVLAANLPGPSGFMIDGFVGSSSFEDRRIEQFVREQTIAGTRYRGFLKRSYAEGSRPSVNHLIIVEDPSPSVTHFFPPSTSDDDHTVFNLENNARIYYLLFAGENGLRIDDESVARIMDEFLLALNPGWGSTVPGNDSGQMDPGGTASPLISLDAAHLRSGDYTALLSTSWMDATPPGSLELPFILSVVDAPGVSPRDGTAIDFGSVTAGSDGLLISIPVSNLGSLPLEVAGVSTNSANLVLVSTDQFQLAPGETSQIDVFFIPDATGNFNGSLNFTTNDPTDSAVTLHLTGDTIAGPLQISPIPVSVVLKAGDTAELTLNLENTAVAPLDWSIASPDEQSLDEVLLAFDANAEKLSALITGQYFFRDGTSGDVIGNGGNNMYNWGNELNTNLRSDIPYRDGEIGPHSGFGSQGRYFTRKKWGIFLMAADLDDVTSFSITGNLGLGFDGSQETSVLSATIAGVPHTGFFKRTFGAEEPSVNHLIIVPNPPSGADQRIGSTTRDDLHRVTGIGTAERIYYLLFASEDGGRIDDVTAQEIMVAFLQTLRPHWADVGEPASGQLTSLGDTIEVPHLIDSTGLAPGSYYSAYDVNWDDGQSQGSGTLPLLLLVTAAPNLQVIEQELDFGIIATGSATGITINIANTGSGPLNINGIGSSDAAFTASLASPVSIDPGQSLPLTIGFDPAIAGSYAGSLTIDSDDPTGGTAVIGLSGTALDPPLLANLALSLDITANGGPTANGTLALENSGDMDLEWRISNVTLGTRALTLSDVRQALDENFAGIINKIPNRFDFTGGTVGTSISSEPGGIFQSGNEITVNQELAPLPYLNGPVGNSSYFTRKYPGLFVFAANINFSSDFRIGGMLGESGDLVDGERIDMEVGGIDYHGFVKRVHGAGVPSVNHLIILPARDENAHVFSNDPNDDSHTVTPDPSFFSIRIFHLLFSSADGSRIGTEKMTEIMKSFLSVLYPVEVNLSSTEGTLAADESTVVQFEVDTGSRAPGTYTGSFRLISNSATNSFVFIPLNLEILPPDISLSPGSLNRVFVEGDSAWSRFIAISSTQRGDRKSWTARSTVPWISLSRHSGSTPGFLEITIDPAAMPHGMPEVGAIEFETDETIIPLVVTTLVLPFQIDQMIADPTRPLVYGIRQGGLTPDDSIVYVIDSASGSVAGTIPVGSNATDATLHNFDQKLYVTNFGSEETQIIDLSTLTIQPPLLLDDDVSQIASGPAGRLIVDSLPIGAFRLVDSSTGAAVALVPAALNFDDGDGSEANGFYYRVNFEQSTIQRFALSNEANISSISAGPLSILPDTDNFLISRNADRVFFGGLVLDRNLNQLGDLGEEVFSASPVGDLVVTETAVKKLSAGGTDLLQLPFPTQVSAISGNGDFLVLFDPVNREVVSLPLRQFRVTPNIIDFGEVTVPTSSERTITVENRGVENLTVASVHFQDDAFSLLTALPLHIPTNGSAQMVIRFTPNRAGSFEQTFAVQSNFIDRLSATGTLAGTAVEDLSGLPGYRAWQALHFASPDDPDAGLHANPDGDAWINLVEFLYFLDPVNGETPAGHLPEIVDLEEDAVIMRYRRAAGLNDDIFRYQSSTDLSTWTEIPANEIEIRSANDLGDGSEELRVALPRAGSRNYYRIANDY